MPGCLPPRPFTLRIFLKEAHAEAAEQAGPAGLRTREMFRVKVSVCAFLFLAQRHRFWCSVHSEFMMKASRVPANFGMGMSTPVQTTDRSKNIPKASRTAAAGRNPASSTIWHAPSSLRLVIT